MGSHCARTMRTFYVPGYRAPTCSTVFYHVLPYFYTHYLQVNAPMLGVCWIILLHINQSTFNRKTKYQPYGPWPHVPDCIPSTAPVAAPPKEQAGPEVQAMCQFCCLHSSKACDHCKLQFCNSCHDQHTY